MRLKKLNVFVLLVFLWGVVVAFPTRVNAVSENTIRTYNIAGQAVFTLLKGIIQGKVKSFKDVGKSLLYGSVAGYGFYESKRMIGKGHITTGVILANLSASISENVSRGEHPLSYLGYSVGPFRFRLATPFAKKPQAIINIETSPKDISFFFISLKNSNKISFRNGLIAFEAKESTIENARGWTLGIYPAVLRDKPEYVFRHEVIHVVQDLQMMSICPVPYLYLKPDRKKKISLLKFTGFKLNLLSISNNIAFGNLQAYNDRWYEIEAHFFVSNETIK